MAGRVLTEIDVDKRAEALSTVAPVPSATWGTTMPKKDTERPTWYTAGDTLKIAATPNGIICPRSSLPKRRRHEGSPVVGRGVQLSKCIHHGAT